MTVEKQVPERARKRLTQAERAEISDERMFTAAVELILEHGTNGTTLKEIGQRSGYSRGLAGERFGSKEALFGQLVQRFNTRWKVELASHVNGRTGLAAFLASTEACEDYALIEPDKTRAMYILWYESISTRNELRARHVEHHEALRSDAERWIREAIDAGEIDPKTDPAAFSVQFCAFLFGIYYQWLVNSDAIDLRKAFADYRRSVVQLLGRTEAPAASIRRKPRS